MKYRLIVLFIIYLFSIDILFAQYWQNIDNGVSRPIRDMYVNLVENRIYLCGRFEFVYLNIANDNLFAVGSFDSISNQELKRIARWNGTDWEQFGSPLPFGYGEWGINNVEYYKGEYYFAGNFDLDTNNDFSEIIRWDGSQWKSLQQGIWGDSWVNDMVVYNDTLYVAGDFTKQSGNVASYIIAWDGENWLDPFPNGRFINFIRDRAVIDNELFIVGPIMFQYDSCIYGLAKYSNNQICSFGFCDDPSDYSGDFPYRIEGLNGDLFITTNIYLGGDTLNYIAKWIGDGMDTCVVNTANTLEYIIKDERITLFPNPACDQIDLRMDSKINSTAYIFIYDITGKCVMQYMEVELVTGSDFSMNINGLSLGFYTIQLVTNNFSATGRFVKL